LLNLGTIKTGVDPLRRSHPRCDTCDHGAILRKSGNCTCDV